MKSFLDDHSESGFALIEVLVGLTVLAIALLAGLRAIANGADTQLAISQRTLALWSADNVLINLRMSRSFPDIGTTIFNCPQGNMTFVCQQKIITSPNPSFRRVEITVYAANPESTQVAAGPRLAWLTTVIPSPASGVM